MLRRCFPVAFRPRLALAAWSLVALTGLCAGLAPNTAQAQIAPAVAEELMRKSGLWKQLDSLVDQVRSGFEQGAAQAEAQGAAPLPEATRQSLAAAAGRAFAGDRLRATAQAMLAERTPTADLPGLRRWFDSALGQRVSVLEEKASEGDPAAQLQAGVALFQTATPARQALLGELVLVTRAEEALSSLNINVVLAVQEGLLLARPQQPGPSPADMRAALEAQRPQMMQNMAGLALAAFAQAYSTLDDDALSRYIAFLGSPEGTRWTELGVAATEAAMVKAGREWGQDMPGAHDTSRT
jgi:hypothetical protein